MEKSSRPFRCESISRLVSCLLERHATRPTSSWASSKLSLNNISFCYERDTSLKQACLFILNAVICSQTRYRSHLSGHDAVGNKQTAKQNKKKTKSTIVVILCYDVMSQHRITPTRSLTINLHHLFHRVIVVQFLSRQWCSSTCRANRT